MSFHLPLFDPMQGGAGQNPENRSRFASAELCAHNLECFKQSFENI
jgi:hypothetical protein